MNAARPIGDSAFRITHLLKGIGVMDNFTRQDGSHAHQEQTEADANRDPITGAPGSHSIGTGLGAAGAAAAGAAVGMMAGPAGAIAGAVIGGVAGGLAGKEVAEVIYPTDPLVEDAYWEQNYASRPYVSGGEPYDVYRPAYQYGWESQSRYGGRGFDEVEGELGREWDRSKEKTNLEWERAKAAARDAWYRVEHSQARPSDDATRQPR